MNRGQGLGRSMIVVDVSASANLDRYSAAGR